MYFQNEQKSQPPKQLGDKSFIFRNPFDGTCSFVPCLPAFLTYDDDSDSSEEFNLLERSYQVFNKINRSKNRLQNNNNDNSVSQDLINENFKKFYEAICQMIADNISKNNNINDYINSSSSIFGRNFNYDQTRAKRLHTSPVQIGIGTVLEQQWPVFDNYPTYSPNTTNISNNVILNDTDNNNILDCSQKLKNIYLNDN